MRNKQMFFGACVLILAFFVLTGCTAGDPRYTAKAPANFWHGLWHGIISVVAFFISLFNDKITMYEVHNNGGWYNFGFLMGVTSIWGGGSGATWRNAERRRRDEEWEKLGGKLELKILDELKTWVEEEENGEGSDKIESTEKREWEEIEEKVVKKLKRKLKQWAEEE